MEGGLSYQSRALRTTSDVFRPHKQSSHIPDHDGRHFSGTCYRRSRSGLPRRYSDIHRIHRGTPEGHPTGDGNPSRTQVVLKAAKCEFEKTTVEYLGVIISHNSVEMDLVKIAGVADWPAPTNKKEVQSFLGFANFYRRFIQDFSHHARPLFDLTKKEVKWKWTEEEQSAFDSLKGAVTSAPILASPDSSRSFRIEADSSDFATGAVLFQQSLVDNKWHPVSFLSKSLSSVERNYEIHDKEMLAIIRAMEEWRHFLEGAEHQFEVWTDHKNLEYFMTAKKLNRRQARWSLLLARFDFVMHHRPGKTMGKSDALSRRSDHGSGAKDNDNMVL